MNKTKITHVISDGNVGGAGILLASLVDGLKKDFEIEVILPIGSALLERLPRGVKTSELPFARDKSFSMRDVNLFSDYFKKNPCDAVHTHAALSARLGAKTAGIKRCISTRHCAIPSAKVKKMPPHKRFLYEMATDLTVSTADFATANLIASGVPNEKIVTIKNGSPDASHYRKSGFSLHDALGIPRDRKIIGCVARLERVKGQDLILRSAKEILKFFPEAHFVFIGCGAEGEEYKRSAARLGIDKSVTFTGYVPTPALYQKDFFLNVNASRGTETSSLATSECMSLGVPTVASSFGGNREMITEGKNGLIFHTDNVFSLTAAILDVLESDELHRALSHGAREIYEERFTTDKMISAYKNLYLSL